MGGESPFKKALFAGERGGIGGVPLDSYDDMRHVTPPES